MKHHGLCIIFILFKIANLYTYEVVSERYSYYLLDGYGNKVLYNELPVASERMYFISSKINPQRTAILVMDPWTDMPTDFLNDYFGQVTASYLLPLIFLARNTGHQIIILTNDPAKHQYGAKINQELLEMIDNNQVHILYHQNYNDSLFSKWLKNHNINTLIYTGYASNMCIIGRQMGMIMMSHHGFRIFFVPEASAAIETIDSWKDGAIHNAITTIISQGVAKIIHWQDLMESMSIY